jgi:small subunit ribosomal protein S16
MGRKKMPIYKIVAADSRAPRDGKFIESVGIYNPNLNTKQVDVQEDRVYYWLKSGAKPTDTVRSLLSRQGLLLKYNLLRKNTSESKVNEEFTKWQSAQENKKKKTEEKKLKLKEKKKARKAEGEAKS